MTITGLMLELLDTLDEDSLLVELDELAELDELLCDISDSELSTSDELTNDVGVGSDVSVGVVDIMDDSADESGSSEDESEIEPISDCALEAPPSIMMVRSFSAQPLKRQITVRIAATVILVFIIFPQLFLYI